MSSPVSGDQHSHDQSAMPSGCPLASVNRTSGAPRRKFPRTTVRRGSMSSRFSPRGEAPFLCTRPQREGAALGAWLASTLELTGERGFPIPRHHSGEQRNNDWSPPPGALDVRQAARSKEHRDEGIPPIDGYNGLDAGRRGWLARRSRRRMAGMEDS